MNDRKDKTEMAMLTEKFDAYGEVLPDVAREPHETAASASAALSRIGQYMFWLLVIVIVFARIIYYPASPASVFRGASQATHAITR